MVCPGPVHAREAAMRVLDLYKASRQRIFALEGLVDVREGL